MLIWVGGLLITGSCLSVNLAYGYAFSLLDVVIFMLTAAWVGFGTLVLLLAALEKREELSTQRLIDSMLVFAAGVGAPGVLFWIVGAFAPLPLNATVILIVIAAYLDALHCVFAAGELLTMPWFLALWLSVMGSVAFMSSLGGWTPESTAGRIAFWASLAVMIAISAVLLGLAGHYYPLTYRQRMSTGEDEPSRWTKAAILCGALILAFGLTIWYGTFGRSYVLGVEQGILCLFYVIFFFISLGRMLLALSRKCFGTPGRRADEAVSTCERITLRMVEFWFSPRVAVLYLWVSLGLAMSASSDQGVGVAASLDVFVILVGIAWYVLWRTGARALTVADCALHTAVTAVFWWVMVVVPPADGVNLLLLEILWPIATVLASTVIARFTSPPLPAALPLPAPPASGNGKRKPSAAQASAQAPPTWEWRMTATPMTRFTYAHLPAWITAALTSVALAGDRRCNQTAPLLAGGFIGAVYFSLFFFLFMIRGVQHSFEELASSTPAIRAGMPHQQRLRNRIIASQLLWLTFVVFMSVTLAMLGVVAIPTATGYANQTSGLWIVAVAVTAGLILLLIIVLLCVGGNAPATLPGQEQEQEQQSLVTQGYAPTPAPSQANQAGGSVTGTMRVPSVSSSS